MSAWLLKFLVPVRRELLDVGPHTLVELQPGLLVLEVEVAPLLHLRHGRRKPLAVPDHPLVVRVLRLEEQSRRLERPHQLADVVHELHGHAHLLGDPVDLLLGKPRCGAL